MALKVSAATVALKIEKRGGEDRGDEGEPRGGSYEEKNMQPRPQRNASGPHERVLLEPVMRMQR